MAKSIILWDESFFAFWIATLSFAGSIAICWVPWAWLFRWILRIAAWVILGPWMAIVDRYYFREDPNMTDEEKDEAVRQRLHERFEEAKKAASFFQIRREKALKIKAFSKYMFGKFLVRVPRMSKDLYKDTPLPVSYAMPYKKLEPKQMPIKIDKRIYGQALSGDMIPVREIQSHNSKVSHERHDGVLEALPGKKRIGGLLTPGRFKRKDGDAGTDAGTSATLPEEKTPLLHGRKSGGV